jgi:ABC-type sugar transport system ATPase subunit
MSGEALRGEGLAKVYPDGTRALDGVSFEVREGEVLVLLGPSGCGKSTLLRIIAGLEAPTAGRLTLGGRSLDGVAPGARDVGFVFQTYALYPHLSVARNLSLALEVRGMGRAEVESRVRETARLLGIETLLAKKPGELSGGQQQRVALGRALARRPRLFLMDEPLSNLDALLRDDMRAELKALFRRLGATVVYVTHDQAEAMSLADEVAVMRAGRILQRGAPLDVYRRPADRFVAAFVGSPRMNLWRGRPADGRLAIGDGLCLPAPPGAAGELEAGLRPEDVEVSESPLPGGVLARVDVAEPLGPRVLLTLEAGGARVRALAASREGGGGVHVRLPAEAVHGFDAEGRRVGGPHGNMPEGRTT